MLFLGELNRTSTGANERSTLASTVAGRSGAERATALAKAKECIVHISEWSNFMGDERPQYFEKTSFPVIRLMHRLRTELFEYNERNEQGHLATFEDVAEAAKALVVIVPNYSAPRFAVPAEKVFEEKVGEEEVGEEEVGEEEVGEEAEEVGEVEAGIEALNLEERVDVGGSEKDLAIESLKQAVATITERIDGWFAECIKDLETLEQQEQSNEAS